MAKVKYDKSLMDETIKRDGATLIGEYEKINRDTRIKYLCKCGKEFEKGFRLIYENGGAYCKECTETSRQSKVKKTCLEKFGTESAFQSEVCKEKGRKTCLERFGVEHASQNIIVKDKGKATCFEKYGGHPQQTKEVRDKVKKTSLERYGVECSSQNQEVRDKCKATSLEKYGVEHASQNQEVQERSQKNAKKYKEYVMPSGVVRKVQGYEPFALKDLLQSYTEEQIKSDRKDVPRVSYECEGKQRYYFPDIFIPHENKIVEVKSTWTYACKTDNIQLKKKACEEQGFLYEIWCYDKKGIRVAV